MEKNQRTRFSGFAILLLALTFSWAAKMSAQAQTVNLHLRIALVDPDLNQKPVPFFHVTLKPSAGGDSLDLKTGLDGTASQGVPAGKYQLATPKPIEFHGKRYIWAMDVTLGGAEQTVELSNDNATAEDISPSTGNSTSNTNSADLTVLFDRLKNSVVTVRAESVEGSGFVVDPAGLVVTNNHVVQSSTYLAVQFDSKHKVLARLLAANSDKDIAVLWVDLKAFPEAGVTALVAPEASQVTVGERVFTIGSPFGHEKVLTT